MARHLMGCFKNIGQFLLSGTAGIYVHRPFNLDKPQNVHPKGILWIEHDCKMP